MVMLVQRIMGGISKHFSQSALNSCGWCLPRAGKATICKSCCCYVRNLILKELPGAGDRFILYQFDKVNP